MTENQEAWPQLFGVGTRVMVENARRLGVSWRLTLGTVTATALTGFLEVQLDGDENSITVLSMIAPVPIGTRVYVICTPPAGNYMIGTVLGQQGLQIVSSEVIQATADLTLTTTATLVPGLTATVSSIGAVEYDILGIYDFDETGAGTTVALGELYINGVLEGTRGALFEVVTVNDRATVAQQWHGTATNGDVFELRARKTINVGTVLARITNSTLGLRIYQ